MSERVYLSLGSDAGDRAELLRAAVRQLRALSSVEVVAASPVYETEPWESEPGRLANEQPWYLNCVLQVDTSLPATDLLARLQAIEEALGRTRPATSPEAGRFVPRTMDIDILFYGERVISVPEELHVPHLLLHERAFVLRPLADLAPELEHPTLYRTVRELLEELEDEHEVRPSQLPGHWLEG
jgi:2-amino-4-hydroxy-6-hydroxymethyldihydropteridine diphosphokinase